MDNQYEIGALNNIVNKHIKMLGQGCFINISEFIETLEIIPSCVDIKVLTKYKSTDGKGDSIFKIVRRLTFERKGGVIKLLPFYKSRWKYYSSLLKRNYMDWDNHLILLIPKRFSVPEEIRLRVQQHLNILATQTQIWRNLQKDHSISIIKKFRDSVNLFEFSHLKHGVDSLDHFEEIYNQLSTHLKYIIAVATRTIGKDDVFGFSKLVHSPGPFKISFISNFQSVENDGLTFEIEKLLNKKEIKHLCSESLLTTKVIDATIDVDVANRFKQFIILPIAKSTDIRSKRLELLLLINRDAPKLTYPDILAFQELISLHDKNFAYMIQDQLLSDLACVLTDIQSFPEMYWSKSYDKIFKNLAKSITESIVKATRAHSCTIRLADLSHEKLIKLSVYQEKTGHSECEDILIESQKYESLNAFTFCEFKYFSGRCYVPISNMIPPKLSSRGLKSCLVRRDKTQSEICFAITQGSSAVGTINIESRALHGFDEHLLFLETVSMLISNIYNSLIQVSDAKFITERLSLLNRVHDLKNYIDKIEDIDKQFGEFLRKYILEINKANINYERPYYHVRQKHVEISITEMINNAIELFSIYGKAANDAASTIKIINNMPIFESAPNYKIALNHIIEHLVNNIISYNMSYNKPISSMYINFKELSSKNKSYMRHVNNKSLDHQQYDPLLRSERPPIKLLKNIINESLYKNSIITIDYHIDLELDSKMVQNLGRRMVFNPDTGKLRLGFFMIGLIVRKLGGTIIPTMNPNNKFTIINIKIPARIVKKNNSNEGASNGN